MTFFLETFDMDSPILETEPAVHEDLYQHRAAVTERSSRRLNSVSAAAGTRRRRDSSAGAGKRDSSAGAGRRDSSAEAGRRDSSADSGCGYSKAATPDGTLDGR